MRFYLRKLVILTLLSIVYYPLVACATPAPPLPLPATATQVAHLMPYFSPTPSRTSPPPAPLSTLPVTPPPSSTPFLYILTNDDTLLGLAFRFGVSLEEILAANPGINPHYLTVGKAIVIPVKENAPTVVPSPTVVPLRLGAPHCYPSGDGGTWCTLGMENDQDHAVENVSVWLGLFSVKGENLASQVVVPPLNLLDTGKTLPLMAYFNQPFDPENTVQSELLTALSVEKKTKRYLGTSVQVKDVQINPSGNQAEVTGQVVLSSTVKASALWVVAVAYGGPGEIIGMRKWEAEADPNCLAQSAINTPVPSGTPVSSATPAPARQIPRKCQTFDLTVFSLGPEIKNVEILVEARP